MKADSAWQFTAAGQGVVFLDNNIGTGDVDRSARIFVGRKI